MRVVQAGLLSVACSGAGWLAGAGPSAAGPALPDPWRLCPEAIAGQERAQSIPKHLLSAIALAESGRKHPTLGKRMPWPWTVMAEGQGRYLPSKAAAVAEVRQLQARGVRNIDVGCMQVNLYYHPEAFFSLDQAFEPSVNVAYAGGFLRDLFEATGSWQEAAGLYHSATPEHKIPYRQRVITNWNEQQRLEMAGLTAFGTGPLTAGVEPGAKTGQRIRSPALLFSYAERRLGGPAGTLAARRDLQRPDASTPLQGRLSAMRDGGREGGAPLAGRPVRSLDEEAAFAARRAQYLQELRQAIAEVKRSYAVQVVQDTPRDAAPAAALR